MCELRVNISYNFSASDTMAPVFFFFFFWSSLRDPIACSLLGGGILTQNSGYKITRLCLF